MLCKEKNIDFKDAYGENSQHYYVHGKDNIPFHNIVLPSLLLAHGENLHLLDEIISSEYITLEGKKISTSHIHPVPKNRVRKNSGKSFSLATVTFSCILIR